jgi:hypothetical protein
LRDAALDEASRTKSELRQLRQQHEELLLSSREAASRADVANSQLMGELKLKGFELTLLQVSTALLWHKPAETTSRPWHDPAAGMQMGSRNKMLVAQVHSKPTDRGILQAHTQDVL